MVALVKQETQGRVVVETVCPACGLVFTGRKGQPARSDRYGRRTKESYAWCVSCKRGYNFVSFEDDNGLWVIHKYVTYIESEASGKSIPVATVELSPMPKVAPVITGPGGDYDVPMDIKTAANEQIEQAMGILNKLSKVVVTLMDIARGKAK